MYGRAANTYRKVSVHSASPARVLDELFLRLLRDVEEAKGAIERHDLKAKGELIGHAMAIVAELECALDRDAAPELCDNLRSLYGFMSENLLAASLDLDAKRLDAVLTAARPLREAFSQVASPEPAGTP